MSNRIFINIASYRDPLLPYTIENVLSKADNPENITIGLCWQKGREEINELPFKEKIKHVTVPPENAKGACWARALAFELMQDEDFFWLIDSHMLPINGWDSYLIDQYKKTKEHKAILTSSASGWDPPHFFDWGEEKHAIPRANAFWGNILLQMYHINDNTETPYLGSFLTCCNLFGPASWVSDVPYDPDLFFLGEEISLALRSFTSGYNIYNTGKNIIAHKHDRGFRKTFGEDHEDTMQSLHTSNEMRTKKLFNQENSGISLGMYGLGESRSLYQYEKYAGVSFINKTFDDNASKGIPDTEFL